MGKRKRQQAAESAPAMVPAGSTTWEEYVLRRITPDGRIFDSEPHTSPAAGLNIRLAAIAYPPGTRVVLLRREVTTHATDWVEVDPDKPVAVVDESSVFDDPAIGDAVRGYFADSVAWAERVAFGAQAVGDLPGVVLEVPPVDAAPRRDQRPDWRETAENHSVHAPGQFPATCIPCSAQALDKSGDERPTVEIPKVRDDDERGLV